MGVVIPQVITEDRASGAQVIDGSLDFDGESQNSYLKKTFASAGTEETWTVSVWFKIDDVSNQNHIFSSGANSGNRAQVTVESDGTLNCEFQASSSVQSQKITNRRFRDPGGWYHLVLAVNTNDGTAEDRMKIYINGVRETSFSTNTLFSSGDVTQWMKAIEHNIGKRTYSTDYFDGRMSQFYNIDGQQLDPSNFGYTDGLTNTWRPKKYTGTFGTNGFYLPLDGNSPIEEDKSGRGNDFTPVGLSNSNTIEKATGAFPILNTTNGGRVATVGVRTDTAPGNGPVGVSTHLILALPLVGSANDVSNQINSSRTALTFTAQGNAAPTTIQSNFYGGSYTFDGTTDRLFTSLSNGDALYLQGSNFTVECWVRLASGQTDDRYMVHVANGNQSNSNGSWQMRINASKFNPGFTEGTTQYNMQSTSNYVPNKWTHVAFVREGNEQRLYIDGRLDATTSYTQTPNNLTSGQLSIGGSWDNGGGTINGQIQDVRVYDGVAKYTSNFIPASTDPDILPDTPSGVAGGSALTSIPDSATEGAVAFDGSGDNLSFSLSSGGLGSGDFTLEYFVYQNTLSDYQTHFGVSRGVNGFNVGTDASGDFVLYSASARQIEVVGAITTGKWYHWAFVRSGSTLTGYLDGRARGSYSSSENFSGTTCTIGSLESNSEYTNGFISNFRILKGTALYTSDFTPPTAPLTNVTNTTLLCCQSNTFAGSAAVSPTVTDNYSAGVSLTATPYADIGGSNCTITNNGTVTSSSAGTNSFGLTNAADMTGTQRVDINMGNVSSTFFQSAWTLEMFFKTSNTNDNWFVGSAESGNVWQTGWSINAESGNIKWNYDSPGGGTQVDTGISISTNTWYFMRVQRTPGTSTPLAVWVYSSPTSLLGSYSGTVSDTSTHTLNVLKIGDANGNSNNLNGNWQFANVMITAGTVAHQNVPSLSGGVRTDSATVSSEPILNGNAAATNFNPFTSDINAVRGQESGYATWNPLEPTVGTLSNGNLKMVGSSAWKSTKGTVSVSSGKWYYEGIVNGNTYGTALGNIAFGIGWYTTKNLSSNVDAGTSSLYNNLLAFHNNGGYNNFATWQTSVTSLTAGDVIGIALNKDNNTFTFYKNGVSVVSGTLANTTDDLSPWINAYYSDSFFDCNFGQKPFKFPPPEGFLPLNAANVRPSTVIARPDQYVGIVTYSGNGGTQTISGLNFSPDLVWLKSRSDGDDHSLQDTVRGAGNNRLRTNQTNSENTQSGQISSFNSDGWTMGNRTNESGRTYVGWAWDAGSSTVTNTDGSISSSVRANPTAGFSIVSYTGTGANATVGHGLNAAPEFAIFKVRSTDNNWGVYHKSLGATDQIKLNQTASTSSSASFFQNTEPTSSVIYLGADSTANYGSETMIAYCFAPVEGYSAFGSYTGTQPFIYTGFRPRWIMVRRYDVAASEWVIFDSARSGYNGDNDTLCANRSSSENAFVGSNELDILSNGFKFTVTRAITNGSDNYIYACFAESPFRSARAR